ncbi:MAG: hypothetical protein V4577_24170 [Bacteroidota bacterium]
MASFSYTVDTAPMAQEMHNVSRHVDGTTTAVVAMQVAVIEAERQAADHICSNVNRGFYSLIRSQISQKIARLQSEVDSHLTQLRMQSQAIAGIRARMERDYHMITGRYMKLFNTLNHNLQSRIFELDRPAVELAHTNVTKLTNRYRYLTTTVAVNQLESIDGSQRIISANVKRRGEAAILALQRFLAEMSKQERLTRQILIADQPFWETGSIYLPVAVYEHQLTSDSLPDVSIAAPGFALKATTSSALKNSAYSQSADLTWIQKPARPEIRNEFNRLVQLSTSDQRIKDAALKLFEHQTYQTL